MASWPLFIGTVRDAFSLSTVYIALFKYGSSCSIFLAHDASSSCNLAITSVWEYGVFDGEAIAVGVGLLTAMVVLLGAVVAAVLPLVGEEVTTFSFDGGESGLQFIHAG